MKQKKQFNLMHEKILDFLQSGPKTVEQMLKHTGLTYDGLAKNLQYLKNKKIIVRIKDADDKQLKYIIL